MPATPLDSTEDGNQVIWGPTRPCAVLTPVGAELLRLMRLGVAFEDLAADLVSIGLATAETARTAVEGLGRVVDDATASGVAPPTVAVTERPRSDDLSLRFEHRRASFSSLWVPSVLPYSTPVGGGVRMWNDVQPVKATIPEWLDRLVGEPSEAQQSDGEKGAVLVPSGASWVSVLVHRPGILAYASGATGPTVVTEGFSRQPRDHFRMASSFEIADEPDLLSEARLDLAFPEAARELTNRGVAHQLVEVDLHGAVIGASEAGIPRWRLHRAGEAGDHLTSLLEDVTGQQADAARPPRRPAALQTLSHDLLRDCVTSASVKISPGRLETDRELWKLGSKSVVRTSGTAWVTLLEALNAPDFLYQVERPTIGEIMVGFEGYGPSLNWKLYVAPPSDELWECTKASGINASRNAPPFLAIKWSPLTPSRWRAAEYRRSRSHQASNEEAFGECFDAAQWRWALALGNLIGVDRLAGHPTSAGPTDDYWDVSDSEGRRSVDVSMSTQLHDTDLVPLLRWTADIAALSSADTAALVGFATVGHLNRAIGGLDASGRPFITLYQDPPSTRREDQRRPMWWRTAP